MLPKEEAKEKIAKLVEEFKNYPHSDSMTEEEVKSKFIQPMFEILGWNFRTHDVRLEQRVSNGRFDYAFLINDIPKFFVEAKRPSNDLSDDATINQAKSYAWHKATTWAVLTNFKQTRIFNALIREGVMASQLRNLYLEDYLEDFDSLWYLSRESFETGLINKVAEKEGKKAKMIPVEKKLFEDLSHWREILAKDISKNYSSKYTSDELDEIIQVLLDRLILIKKIEDTAQVGRIIESAYNQWLDQSKRNFDSYLKDSFEHFKNDYNSGIFDTKEIDNIKISDSALKIVIQELYSINDKAFEYDFSIIDADVLGNIYEEYLGYLLKSTKKGAKLGKESIRKKQGIYYTPTYIVDYIIKNTLGEKLKECKSWEDVEKIKVLDPACGSGSFLIKAFDEIYTWYEEKGMKKETLTASEDGFETVKDKIVKKNLFGVDLDQRAVEIAQLNLLLKTADKKHKLPILQDNIKCGNSLIDDEKLAGNKTFNWKINFEKIMKDGGFDIIIGNPPWVQSKFLPELEKNFYKKKYKVAEKQYDLFTIFIERALNLLKNNGVLGFIVPDRFITNTDYAIFRKYLLDNCCLKKIVYTGEGVFTDVEMPSAILIIKKCFSVEEKNKNMVQIKLGLKLDERTIAQNNFLKNKDFLYDIFGESGSEAILKKIENGTLPLKEIVINGRGVEIGKKSDVISEHTGDVKFLIGGDIDRYKINKYHYLKLNKKGVNYKEPNLYKGEKILVRKTGLGINAVLDEDTFVIQVIYIFKQKNRNYNLKYVLGILNSKLMAYYYFSKFGQKSRKTFPHLTQGKVLQLPIKIISLQNQNTLSNLVDKILLLNKKCIKFDDKQTSERQRIEEEIKRTDKEIDELVYKLYGIIEEEKKIIEKSLSSF